MKGIVLAYSVAAGFGHLKGAEGVDEYCFYTGDIQVNSDLLKKGDLVQFEIYRGHGTRAVNVRKNGC